MKLTFIAHSGFFLELQHTALLFDYYEGEIPPLPDGKKLVVFVSHGHYDHFNEAVFRLSEQYGRERVHYVLASDIGDLEDVKERLSGSLTFMKPHEKREVPLFSVEVETLRSNDSGVAYLIGAEGKRIYHAGDLQLWDWPGEPEADNRHYRKTYEEEIRRIAGCRIDLAMLVLDPRQEASMFLGMDASLSQVKTRYAAPMHGFGSFSQNTSYRAHLSELQACGKTLLPSDGYLEILRNGQSFLLD